MDQYSSPKNIISNSSLPFSSHSPFYLFAHPAHALSSKQTFRHLLRQKANTQNVSFELFIAAHLHYQPSW